MVPVGLPAGVVGAASGGPPTVPSESPALNVATETSTGVPGFGAVVTLASLLSVALLARHRA